MLFYLYTLWKVEIQFYMLSIICCRITYNIMIDIHYSLLTPIGEHRSKFVIPSKGKRDKRNKGKSKRLSLSKKNVMDSVDDQEQGVLVPPLPVIASFLTIGFNSTERCLEAAAQSCVPASISDAVGIQDIQDKQTPLAAVFVDRSDYPPLVYSHLPLLVATASQNTPLEPQIRLIALSKGAGTRLSAALHIPRTAIIGLGRDAPGARSLVNFIQDKVAPIEVPWLLGVLEVSYLPVSISATTIMGSGPAGTTSQPVKQPPVKKQKTKEQAPQ